MSLVKLFPFTQKPHLLTNKPKQSLQSSLANSSAVVVINQIFWDVTLKTQTGFTFASCVCVCFFFYVNGVSWKTNEILPHRAVVAERASVELRWRKTGEISKHRISDRNTLNITLTLTFCATREFVAARTGCISTVVAQNFWHCLMTIS